VDDSRKRADSKVDEALEETFPASDPPANTVETGIGAGALPSSARVPVTDNETTNRFELSVDGHTAFLVYERTDKALTLIHTEVPVDLRGRHLGEALIDAALRTARSAGLRIVAVCPFVKAYMRKHVNERYEQ
jgi:predicted GNAT family acetyltransferase